VDYRGFTTNGEKTEKGKKKEKHEKKNKKKEGKEGTKRKGRPPIPISGYTTAAWHTSRKCRRPAVHCC